MVHGEGFMVHDLQLVQGSRSLLVNGSVIMVHG